MIRNRSILGIPFKEYWFGNDRSLIKWYELSVIRGAVFAKDISGIKDRKLTLISELNYHNDDAILGALRKKLRYDVRSFSKKSDRFRVEHIHARAFIDHYNEFAKTKSLRQISIDNFNDDLEKFQFFGLYLDGILVCSHCYICNGNITRLMHSALHIPDGSEVTNDDSQSANKYLHFFEMKYYTNQGVQYLDWGGVSFGEKEKEGIDNFKRGFGGVLVEYYDYYSPAFYLMVKVREKINSLIG